jgi:hypothetical protein
MPLQSFISEMDALAAEMPTPTDLAKYVEQYNSYVQSYKETILPHYLATKLELDNLEYCRRIDPYVKSHWIDNRVDQFRVIQSNYNKLVNTIKKLYRTIRELDVENTISLTVFEEHNIVPNTISKIIASDSILRQSAARGEVRLYYGSIHFSSDSILEDSRRIPGLVYIRIRS